MKNKYLLVFCLALLLRAGLALFLFGYYGDVAFNTKDGSSHYLPLAKNLASGKGFTLDGINPYAYKAPGYPLFLAFFYKIFGVLWPAIIVQIILSSLLAVLIFKIGEEAGFGEKISFFAGILTATAPHLIYYGDFFVTEALFAFFLLLGIFFFIKFLKETNLKYALLSGFFLGLDTLVKVSTQYLLIVCLIIIGFAAYRLDKETRKKFLFFSVAFIFVFIAVITPLAVRNYKLLGTFQLNSQSAYLLYRYEGSSIVSVRDKINLGDAEKIARKEILAGTGLEDFPEEKLVDLKYSPILFDRTFALMKKNIGAVFKIGFVNVLAFWTHSNYAYFLVASKIISAPSASIPITYALAHGDIPRFISLIKLVLVEPYYLIAFVSRVFWFAVAFFAFCAFFSAVFRGDISFQARILILFLFLTIFYYNFTTMILGFGVEGRLRYNVEPIMYLLAVWGISSARRFLKACKNTSGMIVRE